MFAIDKRPLGCIEDKEFRLIFENSAKFFS